MKPKQTGALPLAVLHSCDKKLSACQMKEMRFVGEGENWIAEVTVNQTEGDETYQIELTYKGKNVAEIETFSYYVDTINNGIVEFCTNEASLDGKGV